MTVFLDLLLMAHIAAGFVGLGAFWIPIFTRKGGASHKRFGKVFAYCAYFVTLSAVAVSIERISTLLSQGVSLAERPEPYGFALFLGYLGIATFASVRHSVRVVQTRRQPERLRTLFHRGLAWLSIASSLGVIVFALSVWSGASVILLALSPVGVLTGIQMLRMMRNPGAEPAEPMGWFYSHMGSMLGGGIAFHTAFAVFGAQRLFDYSVSGPLAFLSWILPTLIGVPAIALGTRHYRRKFSRTAGAHARE